MAEPNIIPGAQPDRRECLFHIVEFFIEKGRLFAVMPLIKNFEKKLLIWDIPQLAKTKTFGTGLHKPVKNFF